MNRVVFLVDGFNIYHALDAKPSYHKYKWLDLKKLAGCFIRKTDQIAGIVYFTAYATWDQQKAARHKIYARALQTQGVEVALGKFKYKERRCRNCNQFYPTYEEKETDVHIATRLFQLAVQDIYDTVLILSGDSDLIPAIKSVKATFPAKKIGVVIPIARSAEDIKNNADFYSKIKEKHLRNCQLPETIDLGGGDLIKRPAEWV